MYTTEDKPLIIKSEPKSWADKAAELKLPYREFIAGLPEGEPMMTPAEYNRFMLAYNDIMNTSGNKKCTILIENDLPDLYTEE